MKSEEVPNIPQVFPPANFFFSCHCKCVLVIHDLMVRECSSWYEAGPIAVADDTPTICLYQSKLTRSYSTIRIFFLDHLTNHVIFLLRPSPPLPQAVHSEEVLCSPYAEEE